MFNIPSPQEVKRGMSRTFINSDEVVKYRGKLYDDIIYGGESLIHLTLNSVHMNGYWDLETDDYPDTDEYHLRMISRVDSNLNILLNFPNVLHRKYFVDKMTMDKKVRQTSMGMNLQTRVNENIAKQKYIAPPTGVQKKVDAIKKKAVKTGLATAGLGAVAWGVYKMFISGSTEKTQEKK